MDQQTAAAAAAPVAERSFVDDTVQYVLKNKLKTVLYTWAGGITACMVRAGHAAGGRCGAQRHAVDDGVQCSAQARRMQGAGSSQWAALELL